MYTFLGIEVPLEKVKLLFKTLLKEKKSIFKVYLCESESHTRTEHETAENKIGRCMGFVGVVRESFTPSEITTRLKEFEEFMHEKEEIFKKLNVPVTCGTGIRAGIRHRVDDYIDDLPDDVPDDEEWDDYEAGYAYYKVDDVVLDA